MEKLNKLGEEQKRYKAKIHTNAKGQASFEVRVVADTLEEIQIGCDSLIKGCIKVCADNSVPLAEGK